MYNIRSAPKNLEYFETLFYDSMYNNMNFICLTETWFNEDTVEIYNLRQYNGTHIYRSTNKEGVVSIFVKKNIQFTRLGEFCCNESNIETVAIHVNSHEIGMEKVLHWSIYTGHQTPTMANSSICSIKCLTTLQNEMNTY